MAEVIFKKNNPESFQKYWDEYVIKHQVSPRYTSLALNNFLEMSASESLLEDDQSFVLVQDKKPIACVFLPIEKIAGRSMVTFRGHYVIAPIFADEKVIKKIFRTIDAIAIEKKISKIMLDVDVLEHENYAYNFLERFDYLSTSLLSYLIDLGMTGDLLKYCRRGHRCDIKKIMNDRDFSINIVDKSNPNYSVHEIYREIHRKAAGRVTRSKASFDSQFEKLNNGMAAIIALRFKEKIIAASYFESHGKKVLYASGAEEPIYNKLPLYHSMVFAAMKYYKQKGFQWLEVSQPVNPSAQFDYYPNEKQLNIGKFKRGFGGHFVDHHRGVKYFDRELFEQEADNFKKNYQETIQIINSNNHIV